MERARDMRASADDQVAALIAQVRASAAIYSVTTTAKANGLNPPGFTSSGC